MVVREALLRLPLIRNIRQFMALGNDLQNAMRKAATVVGEKNYDKAAIAPVVTWATSAQVLDLGVRVETLVNEAVATKEARRAEHVSHPSHLLLTLGVASRAAVRRRPLIFTDINSMEIQVARGHAGSLRSPRIFLVSPDFAM